MSGLETCSNFTFRIFASPADDCKSLICAGAAELADQIDARSPPTDTVSVGARLEAEQWRTQMQVSAGPVPVGPRLKTGSVPWLLAVSHCFHQHKAGGELD